MLAPGGLRGFERHNPPVGQTPKDFEKIESKRIEKGRRIPKKETRRPSSSAFHESSDPLFQWLSFINGAWNFTRIKLRIFHF